MDTARRLARWNIAAFERVGADVIVVNASGCGAAMKEYGHLLRDDPAWSARAAAISARVRDVSEVLAAAGPRPGALPPRVRPLRIAYDAPCHLHHAQRVTGAPLQVLHAIAGAELVPLADADQCCGSAGIYNLVQPALADAVLARKLDAIAAAGADIIVTGNPGCLMQIGAGLLRAGQRTRVMHLVDLLDAAYTGREP
jgi:glycolate oxidase iron-sulfur subunit